MGSGARRGEVKRLERRGGAENINLYRWAGAEVEALRCKLVHEARHRRRRRRQGWSPKAAGRDEAAASLIWINGENFASMKKQQLLLSPGWAEKLPNWQYVDVEGKPTVRTDFTIPVDGLESPWGMAKLVFFHDTAKTAPASMPKSKGIARLGEEKSWPLHLSAAA